MAAVTSQKSQAGMRPPPPPIAEASSPTDFYESTEPYEGPPQLRMPQRERMQPSNRDRRSLPPVPLADDDYIEPDVKNDEYYLNMEDGPRDRPDGRPSRGDQYYEEPRGHRPASEYYVDTAPNRNSLVAAYDSGPQNYHPQRHGSSPPDFYPPQDNYEDLPFEDEYDDGINYHGYPPPHRQPVDRRQSRKNMGRAIMVGLNTARVKEIKLRLRPAFTADEMMDNVEKRNQAAAAADDDLEDVDVSSLSVAERMKLIQAKTAKKPPPQTYPKPPRGKTFDIPPVPVGAARTGSPRNGSPSAVLRVERPDRAVHQHRNSDMSGLQPPSHSPQPHRSSMIALDDAPWYFGNIDQHKCEEKLRILNKEGAFVIRISKSGESRMHPYTMCVFHEGDVYNLMIRLKPNGQFAVGSEKPGEPEFSALADLVKFHADIPIEVIPKSKSSSKSSNGGRIWLTMSPLK